MATLAYLSARDLQPRLRDCTAQRCKVIAAQEGFQHWSAAVRNVGQRSWLIGILGSKESQQQPCQGRSSPATAREPPAFGGQFAGTRSVTAELASRRQHCNTVAQPEAGARQRRGVVSYATRHHSPFAARSVHDVEALQLQQHSSHITEEPQEHCHASSSKSLSRGTSTKHRRPANGISILYCLRKHPWTPYGCLGADFSVLYKIM